MRHVAGPAAALLVLAPVPAAAIPFVTTPASFEESLHLVTRSIEVVGIAVIVAGALVSSAVFVFGALGLRPLDGEDPFQTFRASLGRAILLGLEFLVAADIIGTVALEPTLDSVAVLGGVVLIRTFLSFSLEVEIEGRLPWRRNEGGRRRAGKDGDT